MPFSSHRPHFRVEITQFWGDDNARLTDAARLFLARKCDILMGGATGSGKYEPARYTGENPALDSFAYIAHWNPDVSVVTGTIEPWLTAHGYPVESAWEHHRAGDTRYDGGTGDGTLTSANRVKSWFDAHGTVKHVINPDDPGIRAFFLELLGTTDLGLGFTGIFLDMYGDPAMVIKTTGGSDLYHIRGVEHPSFGPGAGSWGQAIIDHVAWLRAQLPASAHLQINTAQYKAAVSIGGDGVNWPTFNHECAAAAGMEHRELDNIPRSSAITSVWDYWRTAVLTYGTVVQVLPENEVMYSGAGGGGGTLGPSNYRDATLDNQALLDAGWWWDTPHRYITGAYRRAATAFCSFLLAITNDPDKWIFTPEANLWDVDPRALWIGIADFDPGAPVDATRVQYATGAWGAIWMREFANCWVYFRTQPSTFLSGSPLDFYWDSGFTTRVTYDGSGDARNAPQTVTFPGSATGYFVRHDGTIDPTPRTSIGLCVMEGAVIAKSPATGGVVASAVAVTPAAASREIGATVQLAALATENAGLPLRLLTSFTWVSLDPSVATVDAAGLVTAVGNGTVTIRATEATSGVVGTATITVERQRTEWLRASDVTGKLDGQDVTNWPAANGTALIDFLGTPLQYVAVGRGGHPAIKGNGSTRQLQLTAEMPATIDLWMVTRITGDGTSAFPRLFESGRYRCNLDNANRALQFLAIWSTGSVQFNTPNGSVPTTGDLDVRIQYDSVGSPGTATIWLNGIAQSLTVTDTHSGTLAATGTLYVANRSALDRGFAGQFSEIEWYNALLAPDEAATEAARLDALYGGDGVRSLSGTVMFPQLVPGGAATAPPTVLYPHTDGATGFWIFLPTRPGEQQFQLHAASGFHVLAATGQVVLRSASATGYYGLDFTTSLIDGAIVLPQLVPGGGAVAPIHIGGSPVVLPQFGAAASVGKFLRASDLCTRQPLGGALGSATSGQPWQVLAGTQWARGAAGEIIDPASGGPQRQAIVAESGVADFFDLHFRFGTVNTLGSMGAVVRCVDANNYLAVYRSGQLSLHIVAYVDGTLTVLQDAVGSHGIGAGDEVVVSVRGSRIALSKGGVEKAAVTTNLFLGATRHGLGFDLVDPAASFTLFQVFTPRVTASGAITLPQLVAGSGAVGVRASAAGAITLPQFGVFGATESVRLVAGAVTLPQLTVAASLTLGAGLPIGLIADAEVALVATGLVLFVGLNTDIDHALVAYQEQGPMLYRIVPLGSFFVAVLDKLADPANPAVPINDATVVVEQIADELTGEAVPNAGAYPLDMPYVPLSAGRYLRTVDGTDTTQFTEGRRLRVTLRATLANGSVRRFYVPAVVIADPGL